jgi:EmrB/QacA subfamily drug resistance transporter
MTKQEKRVLYVSILASFVAFLDGSVVTVALPAIVRELGGGLLLEQWVVDAYLITLGSLMLLAGALADRFGRKRIMLAGLWGFGLASLACALAPTGLVLIIARALQGIAGSLLVPSSLAFIIAEFRGQAQGKAIGTWTAWTGIAFVIGPLLGGVLVDSLSWRLIFGINILPIALTLWLMRHVEIPEPSPRKVRLDYYGACLCTFSFAATVYGLIEEARYGWSSPYVYVSLILGIAAFIAFIGYERRTAHPMLPLHLFAARNFLFGNIATFAIYGALSIATFLLSIFVQQVGGYTALEAGLSLLPVTILMFALSSRFGAWSGKIGPRLFMTFGPLVAALGFVLMLRVDASAQYWTTLLPGILLFGLGLSATVAPLTSAVLGAVDQSQAGIGSAINNAVARIAGLIAIAALAIFMGPTLDVPSFHISLIITAVLLALGGGISFLGIRNARVPVQT